MEDYQKSILVLLLVMLFFLVLIPVASVSRTILYSIENSLQADLRSARIEVTRAQQRVYSLKEFAHSLRISTSLQQAVKSSSVKYAQWQSPIARMRLLLNDAINESDITGLKIQGLEIEQLGRTISANTSQQINLATERLWLSVNIQSVATGMSLLAQLKQVVAPYPLKTRGCAFRHNVRAVNELPVGMRCLLVLTAWELPKVTDAASADKAPPSRAEVRAASTASDAVAGHDAWQLFNTEASLVISDAVEVEKHSVITKDHQKPEVLPTGIITGPLGTTVVHGY